MRLIKFSSPPVISDTRLRGRLHCAHQLLLAPWSQVEVDPASREAHSTKKHLNGNQVGLLYVRQAREVKDSSEHKWSSRFPYLGSGTGYCSAFHGSEALPSRVVVQHPRTELSPITPVSLNQGTFFKHLRVHVNKQQNCPVQVALSARSDLCILEIFPLHRQVCGARVL